MSSPTQIDVDVVVLGGGPGGYPAAIRAAQHGLKVALVEAEKVGGTCLHQGCIPTKALLASSAFYKSLSQAKEHGVAITGYSLNYLLMWERKNRVVQTMYTGLKNLLLSYPIQMIQGTGSFVEPTLIKVLGDTSTYVRANNVILATGSRPRALSRLAVDGTCVHDSTTLLTMQTLPKSLLIVGGGIIGVEFAALYAALGVEVTVVEMLSTLLPLHSPAISEAINHSFRRMNIKIHTQTAVEELQRTENGLRAVLKNGTALNTETALIAVGRTRNTDQIAVEKAGLLLQPDGEIVTNARMETLVPNLYAVGDITGAWWLAHVASHQGLIAADNIAGLNSVMDYRAIPSAVFTDPEVATVGMSMKEAKKAGYAASEASYPFQALGKSQAAGHPDGFATLIIDSKTGAIIGGEVVGDNASTLIAEIGLAITNELTLECLVETVHAHPTLPEAWLEAAMLAEGLPLHWPAIKRKNPSH